MAAFSYGVRQAMTGRKSGAAAAGGDEQCAVCSGWRSGATVGVLVVRKVTRTAQAYTPEGLGRLRWPRSADGLRELADAVREGMAEREQELRVALGVDAGTSIRQARTCSRTRPAARHRTTSDPAVPGARSDPPATARRPH